MVEGAGGRVVFVATLDQAELAVRLGEAFLGAERPANMTPIQALDDLGFVMDGEEEVGGKTVLLRLARVALEYLNECMQAGGAPEP